jgi:uncharacterized ferritin-like protein (DUF455 family)
MTRKNLFDAAHACLIASDPDMKVAMTRATAQAWRDGNLSLSSVGEVEAILEPGRPADPKLVRPRDLPRRKPNTAEGRAVLVHALTHIEFNAINLGWDAVYRFRDMPKEFYDDWVRVADEEAYHFSLLSDHLRSLGHEYGDYPGHNGLWEMAVKTAHDVMVRMALVPRCLEARGLDVNPGIRAKLVENGDERAGELLDIILRDEIGHVAIGDRWFRYLCQQRGLDMESKYREPELAYLDGVG